MNSQAIFLATLFAAMSLLLALALRRRSFDATVGLEGGTESVGLAGEDRTHDNRGQETGRDPRAEKSGRDRCQEHVRRRRWSKLQEWLHPHA